MASVARRRRRGGRNDGDDDDESDRSVEVRDAAVSRQAEVAAAMLTSDLYASIDCGDIGFLNDEDEKDDKEEKPPEPVVPVKRNQILSSNLVSRRRVSARPSQSSASAIASMSKEAQQRRTLGPSMHGSVHGRRGSVTTTNNKINNKTSNEQNRDREQPRGSMSAPTRRHTSSADELKASSHKVTAEINGDYDDDYNDDDHDGGRIGSTNPERKGRRPVRRARSNDLLELKSNHSTDSRQHQQRDISDSSHGAAPGSGRSLRSGSSIFSSGSRNNRRLSSDNGDNMEENRSTRGQRSLRRKGSDQERERHDVVDDHTTTVTPDNSKSSVEHRRHPSSGKSLKIRGEEEEEDDDDDDDEGTVSKRGRRRTHQHQSNEKNGRSESIGASYRDGRVAVKDKSDPTGMDFNTNNERSSRRGRRDRSITRSRSNSRDDPNEESRRPVRRAKSSEGISLRSSRHISNEKDKSGHTRSVSPSSPRGLRGHDRDRHIARSRSKSRLSSDEPDNTEAQPTKPLSSSSRSTIHRRRSDQRSSRKKDSSNEEEVKNSVHLRKLLDDRTADSENGDKMDCDDEGTVSTMTSNKSANGTTGKISSTNLLKTLLNVTSKKIKSETGRTEENTSVRLIANNSQDEGEKCPSAIEGPLTGSTDKKSSKWGIRKGIDFTRRLVTNKVKKVQDDLEDGQTKDVDHQIVDKDVQGDFDLDSDPGSPLEDYCEPTTGFNKSMKWNLAAKLKRPKKGMGNDGEVDGNIPEQIVNDEKQKKATNWNLASKIKRSSYQEEEENKGQSEPDEINYGLMTSFDSFSEEAMAGLQDLREVWRDHGSETDPVAERIGSKSIDDRPALRRDLSNRRAIFQSLAQPSMRFDFSDDTMKKMVPKRQHISDTHSINKQTIHEDETSNSSSSFDIDEPGIPESGRKSSRSREEISRAVDSSQDAGSRSSSNPPDRRLVFAELSEPSLKFDFSNNRLQKSAGSLHVSHNDVIEEKIDEDTPDLGGREHDTQEASKLLKLQTRDDTVNTTEDISSSFSSSSSKDDDEEEDEFDLQLASALASTACIQIEFGAAGTATDQSQTAVNVRAHKLNRDTSIYGFEADGAVDLNFMPSTNIECSVNEPLDKSDKSKQLSSPKDKNDAAINDDALVDATAARCDREYIRLKQELEASQERAKVAREALRSIQQEIQRKKQKYGEAQRKRELAVMALQRKNIVLERGEGGPALI